MLDRMIDEKWVRASGVFGLFPASMVNDYDIEVYTDEHRTTVSATLNQVRQQTEHRPGVPHRSLADFVARSRAPCRRRARSMATRDTRRMKRLSCHPNCRSSSRICSPRPKPARCPPERSR